VWHQGVFGLGEGTLESLVKRLSVFDFAILVLTPDDLVASRGNKQTAPRDNVLLELGMCIGGIGSNRTFMIVDRSAELKLPSDLAGITPATYVPPVNGTLRSAVGPACTQIEDRIRELGCRNASSVVSITGTVFIQQTIGKGVSIKVRNVGDDIFPPYEIVIEHPKVGTWRIFSSTKSGQLLQDQEREHRCLVHPTSGEQPLFVRAFREDSELLTGERYEDFVFRLVLEDSDKVLYEHPTLGPPLAKLIGGADTSDKGLGYNGAAETEFFRALHGEWPSRTHFGNLGKGAT
jgi:hypothetical protein